MRWQVNDWNVILFAPVVSVIMNMEVRR
jgi:hypothetical protein